jgi:hypothetical protein
MHALQGGLHQLSTVGCWRIMCIAVVAACHGLPLDMDAGNPQAVRLDLDPHLPCFHTPVQGSRCHVCRSHT